MLHEQRSCKQALWSLFQSHSLLDNNDPSGVPTRYLAEGGLQSLLCSFARVEAFTTYFPRDDEVTVRNCVGRLQNPTLQSKLWEEMTAAASGDNCGAGDAAAVNWMIFSSQLFVYMSDVLHCSVDDVTLHQCREALHLVPTRQGVNGETDGAAPSPSLSANSCVSAATSSHLSEELNCLLGVQEVRRSGTYNDGISLVGSPIRTGATAAAEVEVRPAIEGETSPLAGLAHTPSLGEQAQMSGEYSWDPAIALFPVGDHVISPSLVTRRPRCLATVEAHTGAMQAIHLDDEHDEEREEASRGRSTIEIVVDPDLLLDDDDAAVPLLDSPPPPRPLESQVHHPLRAPPTWEALRKSVSRSVSVGGSGIAGLLTLKSSPPPKAKHTQQRQQLRMAREQPVPCGKAAFGDLGEQHCFGDITPTRDPPGRSTYAAPVIRQPRGTQGKGGAVSPSPRRPTNAAAAGASGASPTQGVVKGCPLQLRNQQASEANGHNSNVGASRACSGSTRRATKSKGRQNLGARAELYTLLARKGEGVANASCAAQTCRQPVHADASPKVHDHVKTYYFTRGPARPSTGCAPVVVAASSATVTPVTNNNSSSTRIPGPGPGPVPIAGGPSQRSSWGARSSGQQEPKERRSGGINECGFLAEVHSRRTTALRVERRSCTRTEESPHSAAKADPTPRVSLRRPSLQQQQPQQSQTRAERVAASRHEMTQPNKAAASSAHALQQKHVAPQPKLSSAEHPSFGILSGASAKTFTSPGHIDSTLRSPCAHHHTHHSKPETAAAAGHHHHEKPERKMFTPTVPSAPSPSMTPHELDDTPDAPAPAPAAKVGIPVVLSGAMVSPRKDKKRRRSKHCTKDKDAGSREDARPCKDAAPKPLQGSTHAVASTAPEVVPKKRVAGRNTRDGSGGCNTLSTPPRTPVSRYTTSTSLAQQESVTTRSRKQHLQQPIGLQPPSSGASGNTPPARLSHRARRMSRSRSRHSSIGTPPPKVPLSRGLNLSHTSTNGPRTPLQSPWTNSTTLATSPVPSARVS